MGETRLEGALISEQNVELVRSLYRAGEPSRFFDLLDEEVGLDFSAYPVPGSAVLRGKAAAIDWSRRRWGTWDEYVLEATGSSLPPRTGLSSSSTSADAGREAGRSLSAVGQSSTPFGWARW
jgi:hypothetical protein